MKLVKNIKSKEEGIEALKELYIAISCQQVTYRNNIKGQELEEFKDKTTYTIEEMLKRIDGDSSKEIQFLRTIIEDMIGEYEENNQESEKEEQKKEQESKEEQEEIEDQPRKSEEEVKENLRKIFKDYYQKLIDKLETFNEKNSEEERMLALIKNSNVKIYEDKSEQEKSSYGEFIKRKEMQPQTIYKDENILFTEEGTYITRRILRKNSKIIKIGDTVETENLSKYNIKVKCEKNKIASTEFYGEKELGDTIKKGKLEYFSPMMAAIGKAKEEGKEHIGRIRLIDEELGTFVVSYDDDLEEAVKELIKKDKPYGDGNDNKSQKSEKKEGEEKQ